MGLLVQIHDLWWVLASVAVAVYIGSKIRTYRRLRAFRGPFSTGFSELWHSRVLLGLRSHVKYKEVCDKYGAYQCAQLVLRAAAEPTRGRGRGSWLPN